MKKRSKSNGTQAQERADNTETKPRIHVDLPADALELYRRQVVEAEKIPTSKQWKSFVDGFMNNKPDMQKLESIFTGSALLEPVCGVIRYEPTASRKTK